jgi:exodeoxyribonuclease-3
MCSDAERSTLSNVKQFGFVDAFRIHNAADKEFSWWDYRAGAFRRNLGLRIDHVWVSEPLVTRSRAALIDKATRAWERPSDHAPVIAEFE